MSKNVFVLGLDEQNAKILERISWAGEYRFRGLLTPAELQHGEIDLGGLLRKAREQLDAVDGPIAAIASYWDFPAATMVPLLCSEYGLPSVSLEAVLRCEHKYWSRLLQREVIDDIPAFGTVDLDDDEPGPPDGVDYPMWLKPVKSFSSELAFHVSGPDEFADAVAEIRAGIGRVGDPFDEVLGKVELPREITEVGGAACLAEEEIRGVQAAVEGYVYDGDVVVYGALDSVNYDGTPSFLRHQYPSRLPAEIVGRLKEISRTVMSHLGFDNATFSIEFFYDKDSGQVRLLEINPRHSQSHAELFEAVDGIANHEVMLRLGLGQDPAHHPHEPGRYRVAGKWMYRRFDGDALVTRVPTDAEIAEIEQRVPGTTIEISAIEGQRLSDLPEQDSYSYELAHLFVRAQTDAELAEKYQACVDALHFEFE
ncbi:ATP-grasp domain-containing protein [Amycolatopsis pithecellobii]|uniref:ATP-grasp domain-containing protein n=1 Tax=Amycolatopsis pithecellobii TaxID=664692 RepID=A0A6N7Z0R0_9PSEU|nr:ATP-grasp domain-containing protein [Amycolatopsis pithecellobii]MTD53371.1 ATP-grasp domain-containing protein [Amycolatopsis pithecellobii]